MKYSLKSLCMSLALIFATPTFAHADLKIESLGSYRTGLFEYSAQEIVAHDHQSQRLFVTNAATSSIDVISIKDPLAPTLLTSINLTKYGKQANSVAVHEGVVVAAVENVNKQLPGLAVFFNVDGEFINSVTVGALPDMVTFSPNGRWVLVANEGEPDDNYTLDPEGSVSVIDLRRGVKRLKQKHVKTADFTRFSKDKLKSGVRVFGPNASVAQDFEPEYITVSNNSKKAWVTLQENNAIAEIDIRRGKIKKIFGLGYKDHQKTNQGLDASNKDDGVNIKNWPILGMYLPDSIVNYRVDGKNYLVTANEGDSRDYSGFSEEARVADLTLDPIAFPNAAELLDKANLGRLKVTTSQGDLDNDGDFDEIYSYGARSFSIWNDKGRLVFDSGEDFEKITAELIPEGFNSDNAENNSTDSRSDDKGPEPEALAIGKVGDETYAFIGLERVSGIMVYNISEPRNAHFVQYVKTRDFNGDPALDTAGDLAPEGMRFIEADKSPNGKAMLAVSYEVSGSTVLYSLEASDD